MPKRRSAGDLFQSIIFDCRIQTGDGFGNMVADWQDKFSRRAGFAHLRGGEAVLAGRLEGRHAVVIFVRACSQTKYVTTDWRIRDSRTGEIYNIRDITPTTDRQWIDFLCESGVANG